MDTPAYRAQGFRQRLDMPKFNIALTPNLISNDVIKIARKFSQFSDAYQLGKFSLPHVTLYQFIAEETEIEALWNRVAYTVHKKSMDLQFDRLSFISYKNIFWLSLLPDKNKELHQLHNQIAEITNLPVKENFDPHMTLINTHDVSCQIHAEKILPSYFPLQDKFILSLGYSDYVGQLTKVIKIIS